MKAPADPDHVVIVGSAPVTRDDLLTYSAGASALICADGGADAVLAAGLLPSLVVGDMDSIGQHTRARIAAAGVRSVEHPPEKDQTDLELALWHALTLQPRRVTILGALGGRRLDHALGNVLLLAHPALRQVDARIVDAQTEVLAIWQERTIQGLPGEYVTLLPLTPRVEGVSTEGLRYPLRDETLQQGYTRGVSNELLAAEATVQLREGCLLLVHERLRRE
ncbi:MAG TPA: thiamine diphosphokinase [Chloroflexota bacterium]|nr:thiamine diphosphokinase [Chloroflexota bacterium]